MGKLIVTIARQYGSGGKTIGQMLAENLGVNCYNREILRMASDDSGIKEELFNQADEKLRNNPLFGNSTRIYKGGLIQPDHLSSPRGFVRDHPCPIYLDQCYGSKSHRQSPILEVILSI